MTAYEYQGTGVLMTYLCCAPEQAENLQRMRDILRQAEQRGSDGGRS